MREPLYRQSFDASALLRDHPPRFRNRHKADLFDLAYKDRAADVGSLEVTRWPEHIPGTLSFEHPLKIEIRPDFFDYRPATDSQAAVEWHVNFADPLLFVAYGSGLFAQDEMQVAEHPILASVREALLAEKLAALTSDETGSTPILVRGVQRRIEVATNADASAGRPGGLYGNRFAAAPWEAVRRATRFIDPPTITNFIAMAAPAGGFGDYSEDDIQSIFATAFTSFEAAVREGSSIATDEHQSIIHSGFWGCGAFGGNRKLMIALQCLAARAANVDRLVLHAADAPGADDASVGVDVADSIAYRCGSPCPLDKLVGRVAILGYRWGESDGN